MSKLLESYRKDTNPGVFTYLKYCKGALEIRGASGPRCVKEHVAMWFWRQLLNWEFNQYGLFLVFWSMYLVLSFQMVLSMLQKSSCRSVFTYRTSVCRGSARPRVYRRVSSSWRSFPVGMSQIKASLHFTSWCT